MPRLSGLVSIACLLRSLPLLFCASPRTPLRVLCIVALDTVHVRRRSTPLSQQRLKELAAFLDFQARANAWWDGKPLCMAEYKVLRLRLEEAGLGPWVEEYLRRLRELEARRPSIGGDCRRFDEIRSYREAVVRLSLGTIAGIALDAACIDDALRATHCESDVATLFRMAMQCQIVDDVIDYREDVSAGLPSFLTATESLPLALASTAEVARAYAEGPEHPFSSSLFPLRTALWVLSTLAILAVRAMTVKPKS